MPEYRIKPEFLQIGAGLLGTIMPQVGEATQFSADFLEKSSKLFGKKKLSEITATKEDIEIVSYLGGVVGAPFGFLPLVMDFYSSGLGAKIRLIASKAFETFRLDPAAITQLWLRGFPDETKKENWWKDLQDQGWSEDQIKAAKELAFVLPSPQELILWMAREVFEPDSIKKYGLDEEWEKVKTDLFAKVGVSKEMAKNHWMAHWVHTSWGQMVELLRRGLLTGSREVPKEPVTKKDWEARDEQGIKELYEWYRLVEVTPFWRNLMTETIWEVPTRVDVRRFRDMRTISKDDLRGIYHRQGYHGKDLDDYVLWTEVFNDFPDLMARYAGGWITLDDVKHQLVDIDGMDAERFEELLQTKIKAVVPEKVKEARELTISEIEKGVKIGRLSYKQGKDLLMLFPMSEDNADFLLEVYAAPDEEIEKEVKQRDLTKADILTAIAKETISLDDGRRMLLSLKYSEQEVTILIANKLAITAKTKIEKEVKEKDLTKTDILNGIAKGTIPVEDGFDMLLYQKYSPEEITILIATKLEVTTEDLTLYLAEVRTSELGASSPQTPLQYRRLVESYRKSAGLESKEIPTQLLDLEKKSLELRSRLSQRRSAGAPQDQLDQIQADLAEAETRLREMKLGYGL